MNIENVEMKVIGIIGKSIRFGFKMLVNGRDVIVYCEFNTITGDSTWYASNSMFTHPVFIDELLLIVKPKLDFYLQKNQINGIKNQENKV